MKDEGPTRASQFLKLILTKPNPCSSQKKENIDEINEKKKMVCRRDAVAGRDGGDTGY